MLQTVMLKSNLVCVLFIVCLKVVVISSNYSFLKSQDCECYLLGTIGSIEGKSICNTESLQCKCHPNIIGKNCDQCMVGYYNILSGYGCFPCNCNPIGSIKNACDEHTGQCLCKPGYIGSKCDKCDFHTYQTSMQKCEKWNCNLYGSKKHTCNESAHQNIDGKYCDPCSENAYISKSCSPCSACYYVVQDIFNSFEDDINFTINTIKVNSPFDVENHQLFKTAVFHLKKLVQNLNFKCIHDLNFFEIDTLADILIQETEYFHNEVLNMTRIAYEIFEHNTIEQYHKYIIAGITELQDLIKENIKLLENSTIISKTMSRHSKKMTVMSKDALEILNKIEEKVENIKFISSNTLQMCNDTCKLNATYSKIYIQLDRQLLVIQYDIIKANKRINSMRDYIKNLQNKTSFTKSVTETLKSQVYQTNMFSSNVIFTEFYMAVKNFNELNISLQHINQLHDTFKENQNFLNSIWNLTQAKENEIHNGLIKLKAYKNIGDEAIDKFEILKSSVEVVELNYKELETLKKKILIKIHDQTKAVLNNCEEIKNIFKDIAAVVKYMDDLQRKLLDDSKLISKNQVNVELALETFRDVDKQQTTNNLKLMEYQKQLNNIKEEFNHTTESHMKYEKNLKLMQEYLIVLNFIPTTNKQLNVIEKEIEAMEEMISRVDYLKILLAQRDDLRQQVKNIKAIIESIPDNDSTLCEAAQTEPKLT